MIVHAKAPLRLGLAGGGTDVSPFCDVYGGNVVNVTISLFAYCTITSTDDGKIVFESTDLNERFECPSTTHIDTSDKTCILAKGVFNSIVKKFDIKDRLSFKLVTTSESPCGSGLGTSSTMVVTLIKAFLEYFNLKMEKYEIAKLAFEIERNDLGFKGGRQDQYAAVFGGMNFMEFYKDRTVVNPIKVDDEILEKLEESLVLFYIGVSRDSSRIIEEQTKATSNEKSLEAMMDMKEQTIKMKECILNGDLDGIAKTLLANWNSKKKTASIISNPFIEEIYDYSMNNGAIACKLSGAGGGGFLMMMTTKEKKQSLIDALTKLKKGIVHTITFEKDGCKSFKEI